LIYDPFCGVGTILQEAMLLGFEAVGSDIDESEVKKCRSNISWLIKKFKLGEKDLEKSIFVHDISSSPPKILVDAIVTEPYLGKPLKKIPSPLEAKKIIAELVPLYEKALSNYKKILKPNGKIVMIFPKIGSFRSIQNLKIAKIGLKLLNPIPDFVKEKYFFSFKDLSDTNTIFYARPDAKIIREIAVLSIA
jgi:tRNA G10  N-methylase Trm11